MQKNIPSRLSFYASVVNSNQTISRCETKGNKSKKEHNEQQATNHRPSPRRHSAAAVNGMNRQKLGRWVGTDRHWNIFNVGHVGHFTCPRTTVRSFHSNFARVFGAFQGPRTWNIALPPPKIKVGQCNVALVCSKNRNGPSVVSDGKVFSSMRFSRKGQERAAECDERGRTQPISVRHSPCVRLHNRCL